MFTKSKSKGMGGMGGMLRMMKREVTPDQKIAAASSKSVRELVAFATSMEYTVFQLEDPRTARDLRAFVDAQELEYPEMAEVIPIPIIISLLNPKYMSNLDVRAVVDLIVQYVTKATTVLYHIEDADACMSALLELRDIIVRITRAQVRFCELVATLNSFSGYLQNHPKSAEKYAQFIHRALLTATAEYRKMR